MKHALTLTLAILLLAATGRGQSQTNQIALRLEKLESSMKGQMNDLILGTSTPPVAVVGDVTMVDIVNGDYTSNLTVTDEGIRKLAASGEICRVLGFHCYDDEWLSDNAIIGNARRKCKLCGKVEPNWRIK